MWKQHISVCLALALLAIPVYFADSFLLKKGGSGWISLSFQGLIIIPYIAFAAVHILVSSLAVFQFPATRLLPLHVVSGIITIGLLIVGFTTYLSLEDARTAADYKKRTEIVEQLRKVIELRRWWYVPNADAPTELHMIVKFNESGRFSAYAEGRSGEHREELIFKAVDIPHRQAGKGEELTYILPLEFQKERRAEAVSITIYMHKGETDSVVESFTIIFEDKPVTPYDGHFLYEQIPPPSPQ